MKNTDAILADVIATISHRLMDSNEFLIKSHCKMLDANHSLSDAMLEVHQSLCAIRDEMAPHLHDGWCVAGVDRHARTYTLAR